MDILVQKFLNANSENEIMKAPVSKCDQNKQKLLM